MFDPEVNPDGSRLRRVISSHDVRVFLSKLTFLSPQHKRILRESAISDDMIAERGYRSVDDPQLLSMVGISKKHGTGIAIPLKDREGVIVSVQIRFDSPASFQDKSGKRKKLRYLGPPDMDLRVDFPAGPIPSRRIWITEGAKKADSLRTLGEYAISISGVWGWSPGAARKDLEGFGFGGQDVTVAFDSDVETNPSVGKAERSLCQFLKDEGASVKVLRLPDSCNEGEKTGIDDYLGRGHSLRDIEGYITFPDENWKNELVYSETTNTIKITTYNLLLILQNDKSLDKFSRMRRNELSGILEFSDGSPVQETDYLSAGALIEGIYKCGYIAPGIVRGCLRVIGKNASYNPVRDYLNNLVWDGKKRIETLFPDICGSISTDYTKALGKNFLIGSVARIMEPGCTMQITPVLEGAQGTGKSTFVSVLYGRKYSTISRAEIGTKDFISGILGCWGVELSELSSIRKSDLEHIKAVLAAPEDKVRLAYREDDEIFPRQCVFIGTTNESEYLQDATGGRRFFPIKVSKIDLVSLRQKRDQFWAEAVYFYKNNPRWWDFPEQETLDEQEKRYEHDSWDDKIVPWLNNPLHVEFTTTDILSDCLGIEVGKQGKSEQTRVSKILRKLGCEKSRKMIEGAQVRFWTWGGGNPDAEP